MATKNNRRTTMTRRLLRTALLELLQEKPFDRISIREICDRADLNRTTFYLHYQDQAALLEDVEREVKGRIIEYMKNVVAGEDSAMRIAAFLDYIQDNAALFKALLCNNASESFREAFLRYVLLNVQEKLPGFSENERNKYLYSFMMAGCVSVIVSWIEAGFDLNSQQMARLIFTLCENASRNIGGP